MSRERQVPVLEVGGTHVSAAWVDCGGGRGPRVLTAVRRPLDSAQSVTQITAQIAAAAGCLRAEPGRVWGIAMPGPFDEHTGVGNYADVAKFAHLTGASLPLLFAGAVRTGQDRVALIDDGEAFLLGEWHLLGGSPPARWAGLTLGTGIGSAFIAGGVLQRTGPDVPPGGRLHRTSVDGVPLEEVASRRAIIRAYRELAADGPERFDVVGICARARAGDHVAAAVLQYAWQALGLAVAPWLRRFGADRLIVGGSISQSWDLLEPALAAGLGQPGHGGTLTRSSAPEAAPLIGAAICALHAPSIAA